MRKGMALLLAGILAASALAGCNEAGGANKEAAAKAEKKASDITGKTVVFIPKLTGNAFFESAAKGAQKYGKEWGINVDYQGSPNAAVADQVSVINKLRLQE